MREREETDTNMRSPGGGTLSPETRGAHSRGRGGTEADTFRDSSNKQINKASQEGTVLGAGREGCVERGQAGLLGHSQRCRYVGVGLLEPGTKGKEEKVGVEGAGTGGRSALWSGRGWRPKGLQ